VGEQTATAQAVARVPPRAGSAGRTTKWLLLGPVLPATWRALGNLVASLAASTLFAAVLFCALAAGLAWLAAMALRLLALAAGFALRPVWRKVRRPRWRSPSAGTQSGPKERPRGSWAASSALLVYCVTIWISARLAWMDRGRIRRLTGSHIAAVPWPRPAPGLPLGARQRAWLESPVIRRAALYQFTRLPVIVAVVAAVSGACAIMAIGLSGNLWTSDSARHSFNVPAGVAFFFVWPVVLRLGSALDVALARALLGPSRTGQLSAEVEHLGEARAQAVESAESERRRIERDLHDGLQPRLVSLALELGIARSRFEGDPDYARSLLEQAHEQAKIAIQDLRSLVRGIHPSVLDERGLDAALSALVASCAVPVRVDVRLTRRPDRPQEAVAYFVVAEAITNVTKHSCARAASVTITDDGDACSGGTTPRTPRKNGDARSGWTLRVLVEDDGRGGAAIEPGGGLAGLAARVAAIDGTLTLTSPPGGPTRVAAELPCGR
jgi:signal transduction histidine kinase